MILYKNTIAMVCSPDGDTNSFDIFTGVLQGDTLAPYMFMICLDCVPRTSIDLTKKWFHSKKKKKKKQTTSCNNYDRRKLHIW